MITGIIAVLFVIAAICAAGDGDAGTMWIGIGVAVLFLLLGSAGRSVDRATSNFIDYWSKRGP